MKRLLSVAVLLAVGFAVSCQTETKTAATGGPDGNHFGGNQVAGGPGGNNFTQVAGDPSGGNLAGDQSSGNVNGEAGSGH